MFTTTPRTLVQAEDFPDHPCYFCQQRQSQSAMKIDAQFRMMMKLITQETGDYLPWLHLREAQG